MEVKGKKLAKKAEPRLIQIPNGSLLIRQITHNPQLTIGPSPLLRVDKIYISTNFAGYNCQKYQFIFEIRNNLLIMYSNNFKLNITH